ncbi:MAG: hypothetical protein HZB57_07420 [Gammaproteobacteria bacterium]|nr:hypothetical protein [Gammaproteobacteria bacterium]
MPDPHQLLQPEATVSLAAWYASPLEPALAADLQLQARQLLQRVLASGGSSLAPRLAEMIAGFWHGRIVTHDYRSLVGTVPEAQQAAVELVYGQLLMSRKQTGAMQHLDRGFELATAALAPAAYFILLRRHTLLRNLVLTPAGAIPQTLPDLLQEARVIQRLQPSHGLPRNLRNPHDDTLG